jgi:hypothetical protein
VLRLKWTSPLIAVVAAFALLASCNKKSTGPEGPTRPAAPSELTVEASDTTTVMLSWRDNANNEEGFRVYEWDGVQWTLNGTTAADSTHYLVTGLWPGTEYGFRVSAFNSVGESDFSTSVTISTTSVPSAPQNVTAQTLAHNRIRLSWIDVSDDELGFVVQRHTETDTFVTIATTAPNDTTYDDNNLTPETLYYYRVGALGPVTTRWSLQDTTRTWPHAVPDPPSHLTAEVIVGTGIQLTWQDNSYSELFFFVFRNDDSTTYKRVDSLGANTIAYSDRTVVEDHRYQYRVYAGNDVGISEGTNEVAAYYGYSSAGMIPLARGNQWNYKVREGSKYSDLRTVVLRVDLFGTFPWFLIEEINDTTNGVDTTTLMRNEQGLGVFCREQGSSVVRLLWKYPAAQGDHYFVEGDCVRVFTAKDTVQVPAGEFQHSYGYRRFLDSGGTIDTYIEPGVGILRVRTYDAGNLLSEQVLLQYTILGP